MLVQGCGVCKQMTNIPKIRENIKPIMRGLHAKIMEVQKGRKPEYIPKYIRERDWLTSFTGFSLYRALMTLDHLGFDVVDRKENK